MSIKQDFVYKFNGFFGCPSRCHIRILDDEGKPLVIICSQMAKNPGTSVTNMAEILARDMKLYLEQDNFTLVAAIQNYIQQSRFTKMLDDLVKRLKESKNLTIFALESIKLALEYRERQTERTGRIKNCIWVEHYAPRLGLSERATYAVVNFEPDSWTPSWDYMPLAKLVAKTGYPEDDFSISPALLV